MHKENPEVMWIVYNDRRWHRSQRMAFTGLRRAASVASGLMIAFSAIMLPLSAHAQGSPPVTDPNNDVRCADKPENIPEDVFFLNVFTPASGVVGPGSAIGAWYSDETMPNTGQGKAPTFVLTGPNTNQLLTASQDPFSKQANEAHKECRHQVNMTTTIPATASGGGAYAPGDYTVTLTAYDGDEAPDKGAHVWTFTVAASTPTPSPSPSPTSSTSPASSPGSGSSPTSQVQAASTTGPGLPNTGHTQQSGSERALGTGALLTVLGAAGLAIIRTIRRPGRRSSK
jgi:hypothetical protein